MSIVKVKVHYFCLLYLGSATFDYSFAEKNDFTYVKSFFSTKSTLWMDERVSIVFLAELL